MPRWRDPQKAFDRMLDIGCIFTAIIGLLALAAAFGLSTATGAASPIAALLP